jgi:hypothetical protein
LADTCKSREKIWVEWKEKRGEKMWDMGRVEKIGGDNWQMLVGRYLRKWGEKLYCKLWHVGKMLLMLGLIVVTVLLPWSPVLIVNIVDLYRSKNKKRKMWSYEKI